MKKRKIAILLSALMLCTNISYVGIDGSAEEILLEEPEKAVEKSELQIKEIESGAPVQNQKTGRYGAARTTENKSLYDGTCGKECGVAF